MFDVGWSELLVIGVVALLVVGPKELPALLRTIGRYMGVVKRQANEFRAQFDEAMRDTEFDQLRKDVEAIKKDAESSLRAAEQSVQTEIADAKNEIDAAAASATAKIDEAEHKVEAAEAKPALSDERPDLPAISDETTPPAPPAVNGSASHAYNGNGVDTGAGHGERPERAGHETP